MEISNEVENMNSLHSRCYKICFKIYKFSFRWICFYVKDCDRSNFDFFNAGIKIYDLNANFFHYKCMFVLSIFNNIRKHIMHLYPEKHKIIRQREGVSQNYLWINMKCQQNYFAICNSIKKTIRTRNAIIL